MAAPLKKVISSKSVHWYQCFSIQKILYGDCLVQRHVNVFGLKHKFCKNCYIYYKNVPIKNMFWG